MQSNPQFASFMQSHRGQTLKDAYKAYGYDLDEVTSLLNMGS